MIIIINENIYIQFLKGVRNLNEKGSVTMAFRIVRNDITKVKTDVIINMEKPKVAIDKRMNSAIYEIVRKTKFFFAHKKSRYLDIGEVTITPAFNLNAKYIIHFSSPYWIDGMHGEKQLLRQCYDKCLKLAYKRRCKSIAFPLLSTTYGFPKELGLQIALESFYAFLLQHEIEISLVISEETTFPLSSKNFDNVREHVGDFYIDNKCKYDKTSVFYKEDISDYPWKTQRSMLKNSQSDLPVLLDSIPDFSVLGTINSASEAKNLYSKKESKSNFQKGHSVKARQISNNKEDVFACSSFVLKNSQSDSPVLLDSIPDSSISNQLSFYLQQLEKGSFGDYLQQMINKKRMKNSEVYIAANITKQYFSKLINGKVVPSKTKVLSLAIALHLDIDETIDFLRMSGYAFSPFSLVDKVFEYFILNKVYDIFVIDIALFDFGLSTLVND